MLPNNEFPSQKIPYEFQDIYDYTKINDVFLIKLYDSFDYIYCYSLKSFNFDIISKSPFITVFYYPDNPTLNRYIIICEEEKCIIIELIEDDSDQCINLFITELKQKIDIPFCNQQDGNLDMKKDRLRQCTQSIKEKYSEILINSYFILLTYEPMVAFIVKRFDYPTDRFKNPSFFKAFENLHYNETYREFNQKNFIILCNLVESSDTIVSLAIHKPTLYLVVFKSYATMDLQRVNEGVFNSQFQHPFFVKCYGYINASRFIFIFEYMSNGTLVEVQPSMTGTQKSICILKLLFGINYLQMIEYIHMDLKPTNILVDHNFEIFIGDFGLAHTISNSNFPKNIGSAIYFSPVFHEKIEHLYILGDMYSFGKILYYLCTGKDELLIEQENSQSCKLPSNYKQFEELHTACLKYYEVTKNLTSAYQCILYIFEKKCFFPETNILSVYDYFESTLDKLPKEQGIVAHLFGILYKKGEIVPKDLHKTVKYYEIAASKNFAPAQFELGAMYHFGNGVSVNHEKGLQLMKVAADNNNPFAALSTAELILFGDMKTVKNYCKLSSGQSKATEYLILSRLYYRNRDKKAHYISKALQYLQKSADMSYPPAIHTLGVLYSKGEYVLKDKNKAVNYFKQAAELNYSESFYELGMIYCEPDLNFPPNLELAIGYLKKGAELGNAQSQHQLGSWYWNQLQYKEAKKYFKLAADQNYPHSVYYLGLVYEIYEKKTDMALYFYKTAYSLFSPEAALHLGYLYSTGTYVNPNLNEAKSYIGNLIANSKKFIQARKIYLYIAYYRMGLMSTDIDDAKRMFSLALRANLPPAFHCLGLIYLFYENGEGKAIEYLQKAAEQKYLIAKFVLATILEKKKLEVSFQYYKLIADYKYEKPIEINQNTSIESIDDTISQRVIIFFSMMKLFFYYQSTNNTNEFVELFSKIVYYKYLTSKMFMDLAGEEIDSFNYFLMNKESPDGITFINEAVKLISAIYEKFLTVLFTPPYDILFCRSSIAKESSENINDEFYRALNSE
ncbi:hypothetical protein TRFO_08627 [Tritrichomonas foetus]|uniref:Protein kinase domain-containing protein n=1 Tax=Tritrichomonas foetus TaxID=1144522 RepID=A0A1J4JNE4_9EUKA|nr:hypothetical protein TRFO_08627 [Tritrichomonas foetus]|eukprot:OHS99059.1 hypothetical protein TRFO_08627 [Tritrichomonas foetus]